MELFTRDINTEAWMLSFAHKTEAGIAPSHLRRIIVKKVNGKVRIIS